MNHIYIHIPFCTSKCPYCSFHSTTDFDDNIIAKYISRVLKEIELYKKKYELAPETIYFGGGTPSILHPEHIEILLSQFDLSSIKEITLEINPTRAVEKYFMAYKELGINRISIGVQSYKNDELKLLGRSHNIEETKRLITLNSMFGNVFTNMSFDLIYGLPNQTLYSVRQTLQKLTTYKPSHFSIYCLSLDENVPLYRLKDYLPSDETLSDMYYFISDYLQNKGFMQYELSSFAKNKKVSLHNMAYWSGKEFLGLGASASGYLGKKRYKNNDLSDYLSGSFIKESTTLLKKDIEKEYIILNLRKTQGLYIPAFNEKFGTSFLKKYEKVINNLLQKGLIIVTDYVRISPEHYFISNEVLCEFV
jgi:oxygen-independent coproporphyrinogen-3 oxidase